MTTSSTSVSMPDAGEPLDEHAAQPLVSARVAVVEQRPTVALQHLVERLAEVVDREEAGQSGIRRSRRTASGAAE